MDIYNCKVDSFTYSASDTTLKNESNLTKNKILSIIATKTGSSWGDIAKKPQLEYLFNYLSSDEVSAVTLVTEYNYIDKHHLDDYSKFYSSCFHNHGRDCARIHFFSNNFDENFLIEAVENEKSPNVETLQKGYLGYCVIRPIPDSYLGRLCLSPYKNLAKGNNTTHKIITQKEFVSLFGIILCVETASMREQDKVTAACATSVIWTVLNLSSLIANEQVPSLSQITDIAIGKSKSQDQTFTNTGLTTEQVITALKHYKFESLEVPLIGENEDVDKVYKNTLSRWVNAYVGQDIPLILSGEIYKAGAKQGDHFVCVVGFRRCNKVKSKSKSKDKITINFEANMIDRIYVHDDRYGQYVAIKLNKPETLETLSDSGKPIKADAYPITNDGKAEEEFFLPTDMTIALDNKVRLSFNEIEAVAYSFFEHIQSGIESEYLKSHVAPDDKYQAFLDNFLTNTIWNIELISNNRFKRELRKDNGFHGSSFGESKSDILVKNLPKHMWRIAIKSSEGDRLSDLIFDATEVFSQNIMLCHISYSPEASFLWNNIEALIKNGSGWLRISDKLKEEGSLYCDATTSITSKILDPVRKFDKAYGPLRHPSRDLHDGEIDNDFNELSVRPEDELYTVVNNHKHIWPEINKATDYI